MPTRSSSYDVAVVGAGPAGCVLAARLSEDPDRRVCLVEAGPDYGHYDERRWPAELLDARAVALTHTWETDRDDRSQLRSRTCSVQRRRSRCGELADEEISPWHRAWIDSGKAAGLGGGAHPVSTRVTLRRHAAFAYLDPARKRPNLTIRPDTLVDRVEPHRGRVVTLDGSFEADVIVLAAGAYGSPGILLRSGIGTGLEHDLPVGEELTDHVSIGFGWAPPTGSSRTPKLSRPSIPSSGRRRACGRRIRRRWSLPGTSGRRASSASRGSSSG